MSTIALNSTVKLSASYLQKHGMQNTSFAFKRGTVVSLETIGAIQMVWVNWGMGGEGFSLKEGMPSPIEVA